MDRRKFLYVLSGTLTSTIVGFISGCAKPTQYYFNPYVSKSLDSPELVRVVLDGEAGPLRSNDAPQVRSFFGSVAAVYNTRGGASGHRECKSRDVIRLIDAIKQRVKEQFDTELELEIEIWK